MMSTWAVLAALVGWVKLVEPETVSVSSAARVCAAALGPSLSNLSPNSASSFSASSFALSQYRYYTIRQTKNPAQACLHTCHST